MQALRELKEVAHSLGEAKLWKPTNLEGTRWLPHMDMALEVLDKNFKNIHLQLENILAGGSTASVIMEGRAHCYTRLLSDHKMLLHLNLYRDLLSILARFVVFSFLFCSIMAVP